MEKEKEEKLKIEGDLTFQEDNKKREGDDLTFHLGHDTDLSRISTSAPPPIEMFYEWSWLSHAGWDLVMDFMTDDIEHDQEISREELIYLWLTGERDRTAAWSEYISRSIPDQFLSNPNLEDPVENHVRERLFLSLRRKLFCEIPVRTSWYRAVIRLNRSWKHRWNVLWTDTAQQIEMDRPVSLEKIIVWESVFDPQRYHVLEGNHRVTQWLRNLDTMPTSTSVVSVPVTIIIGRSSAVCHWVHRHLPSLYEWHDCTYKIGRESDLNKELKKTAGIDASDGGDGGKNDSHLPRRFQCISYLLMVLLLFGLVSTGMHLLHPHI